MSEGRMEREQQINLIAYRIWEEEGRCEDRALEHWLRAEAMNEASVLLEFR